MRQVRSFLMVARHASFTKAARAMHLSQPALTVQIRQLEASLGLQLFSRSTRLVELTRLGHELTLKFERILEEFDSAIADSREQAQGRRGTVRLACLQSFAGAALPLALHRFREAHPQISFAVKDVAGERILDMVRGGEVDFAIAEMPPGEPQLAFTPLVLTPLRVVMPVGHVLEKERRLTLARVAEWPLIMLDRETGARRLVDSAFSQSGCMPKTVCEVVALASALAMIRAGLGLAVLPIAARDASFYPGLTIRALHGPHPERWIGIVQRSGRTLPPAAQAFVDSLLA